MDSNGIVRVVTKRMVTFCHDPYNAIKIHSKAQVLIKTSLQETYKSILSKSVTKRDVSMQKINLQHVSMLQQKAVTTVVTCCAVHGEANIAMREGSGTTTMTMVGFPTLRQLGKVVHE